MDDVSPSTGGDQEQIVYSEHARKRMIERKIRPEDVVIALAEPDEIRYGDDGELMAVKQLERYSLEVVYLEQGDISFVITVIRI